MSYYNPKQKDVFEAAVNELVTEELIEKRSEIIFLTEKGRDTIYR